MLNNYKKLNGYESGIAMLHTEIPAYADYAEKTDSILLMDLKSFLVAMADPLDTARMLEEEAVSLVKEWNDINGAAENVGKRFPRQFVFQLSEHTWKRNGKSYTTVFELFLSSFGFTRNNNHHAGPVTMELANVKAVFKMRTSFGVDPGSSGSNCHVAGFKHDGTSYNVPLTYFLTLLRDPKFRLLLEETWAHLEEFGTSAASEDPK